MKKEMTCKNCSTKFTGTSDFECPACAQYFASMLFAKKGSAVTESEPAPIEIESPKKSAPKNATPTNPYSGSASLDDLLKEQERTTHAVRSLAVFFFDWLLTSVIASMFILVGFWIYFAFIISSAAQVVGAVLIVLGALAIIVGFFSALKSGIRELNKSNSN
jgi:hypothetical protein